MSDDMRCTIQMMATLSEMPSQPSQAFSERAIHNPKNTPAMNANHGINQFLMFCCILHQPAAI